MKFLPLILVLVGSLLLGAPTPQERPAGPAPAQPQTFTGTLIDADCKAADPAKPCEISAQTRAYGLQTADGAFLKFESSGNAKVQEALRSGNKTGNVRATVKGSMDKGALKIDSVAID